MSHEDETVSFELSNTTVAVGQTAAVLGDATEARLRNEWAPTHCERFQLEHDGADLLLTCVKKDGPKSAKSHKISLHNQARLWNVSFSLKQFGLLREPVVDTARGSDSAEGRTEAIRQPVDFNSAEIVAALPPDFDSLAGAKYDQIRHMLAERSITVP